MSIYLTGIILSLIRLPQTVLHWKDDIMMQFTSSMSDAVDISEVFLKFSNIGV
jgi:hypothetical protein